MWHWGACWLRDEARQENVLAFEKFEAGCLLAAG